MDRDEPRYLLVIMDNFSRFAQLYPAYKEDAETTATSLIQWFSNFGVSKRWTSDHGSHFANRILTILASHFGIKHHFTATYAPWANGMVERVNREIRQTLSSIMLDRRSRDDTWTTFIPIITAALNNAPSSAIGGIAPITAFMGRTPFNPLDAVFDTDTDSLRYIPINRITNAVAGLRKALDDVHSYVRSTVQRQHKTKAAPLDFDVGDYVLVARDVTDKNKHKDKTRSIWFGPAQVTRKLDDRTFEIKDIATDSVYVRSAWHIKRYADKDLTLTQDLLETASHGGRGFPASHVLTHRANSDGSVDLHVQWEDGDTSWEPFKRFNVDAPRLVLTYLKTLPDASRATLTM